MNDQLQRIKSKDYSNLDERLFSNIGATANMDETLQKLSELQKYLMNQIDNMEGQEEKQVVMKASKIVMNMRQDMGSKVNFYPGSQKCNCRQNLTQIAYQVGRVKKSLKSFKDNMKRELEDCIADMTESIHENIYHVLSKSNRKNSENLRMKKQIDDLQSEIEQLRKQNQTLNENLEKWEQAKQRRKNKSTFDLLESVKQENNLNLFTEASINSNNDTTNLNSHRENQLTEYVSNFTIPISNPHSNDNNGGTPRMPMLLRKEFINRKMSIDISKKDGSEKKSHNTSVKKESKELAEQNSLLKIKGAEIKQCRKSVKKLKLFSII